MLSVSSPDLVFENALLVDGTGAAPRKAEVAVKQDRICALAPKLAESYKHGAQRVDLRGRVLAPGFVDVHAHGELEPLVDNSAAGKVASGVTSEISGNCGSSPFPLMGLLREQYEREARDEFRWPASNLNWTSAAEYLERLEQARCTINRGFLVGHGSLRAAINGYGDGPTNASVRERMRQTLEDCLAAGCFGLSTGLIYPPGCFAAEDEIVELARVCGRRGALYATHMRSESDTIEDSIDETLRLCRVAGVRTQISHLKITARRNWHKLDWLQQRLAAARAEGVDFHADRYPYIATSTGLDSVLPQWAYAGGRDEELKRLQDPATAARMEAEILARNPAPEYWSNIQVASATDAVLCQQIAGRRISDIATEWKLSPFEALRQILIKDALRTSAVMFSMPEEQVERVLSWDFVMVGSDAAARNVSGPTRVAAPHPRTFGTFPRILAKYVRERKVLTLEAAIRRMTSLPAETFHIKDRGVIREGAFADLVVFDAERVSDEATFGDPNRFPSGIEQVYVNGALVVQKGSILDARPGRVLRHGA
jgi:N-acyl-D-amino-acid deacylase